MVFSGVDGAPPSHCGPAPSGSADPTVGPFTTVAATPTIAEKPYVTIDSSTGKYSLVVPAVKSASAGADFSAAADVTVPFESVYVTAPRPPSTRSSPPACTWSSLRRSTSWRRRSSSRPPARCAAPRAAVQAAARIRGLSGRRSARKKNTRRAGRAVRPSEESGCPAALSPVHVTITPTGRPGAAVCRSCAPHPQPATLIGPTAARHPRPAHHPLARPLARPLAGASRPRLRDTHLCPPERTHPSCQRRRRPRRRQAGQQSNRRPHSRHADTRPSRCWVLGARGQHGCSHSLALRPPALSGPWALKTARLQPQPCSAPPCPLAPAAACRPLIWQLPHLAGLLLQAGPLGSDGGAAPVLLEWGSGGHAGSASAPGVLSDVFARVGGPDGTDAARVAVDTMVRRIPSLGRDRDCCPQPEPEP